MSGADAERGSQSIATPRPKRRHIIDRVQKIAVGEVPRGAASEES